MCDYKIGDQVKLVTSGRTGVVKAIYDSGYWNLSDCEYSVELDDGSGAITLIERMIELVKRASLCECGVDTVGSGKHSDYCPMYNKDE